MLLTYGWFDHDVKYATQEPVCRIGTKDALVLSTPNCSEHELSQCKSMCLESCNEERTCICDMYVRMTIENREKRMYSFSEINSYHFNCCCYVLATCF